MTKPYRRQTIGTLFCNDKVHAVDTGINKNMLTTMLHTIWHRFVRQVAATFFPQPPGKTTVASTYSKQVCRLSYTNVRVGLTFLSNVEAPTKSHSSFLVIAHNGRLVFGNLLTMISSSTYPDIFRQAVIKASPPVARFHRFIQRP
ncbi:hypothetical protein DF182_26385 [Chitinophaga flava]|uniref:Uncharacterized protein n=1 Tax=Chitinophaga flava TaxID=2259036 RepID=A0A365XWB9_9BACT|nr:hypothetical protein DF182_26385 [Chitinophaga flava]